MAESILQLCSGVAAAAERARESYLLRDYSAAREAARVGLSFGSKLHSRLSSLLNLMDEGFAAAEVDRAIAREEKGRQTTIGDVLAEKRAGVPKEVRRTKGGKP